ncbi:MAG: NAD(P)H-hydrate dehydratase [Eubacteriales bacterium]|nr:NAD(P)H-hydrate dehydratase [Eubacteriales bacterium]
MENLRLIERQDIERLIKKRPASFHKGDCGRVLIAAGSHGMAGAAALSAKAALRSGAGLVRISAPDELFPILQTAVLEATCITRNLSSQDLKEYNAIVIGPGLGNDFLNIGLIELVAKSDCRAIVWDADAMNMIAKESLFETLRLAQSRSILTPHPGEAARLLGCSIAEIEEDREIAARKLAEKTGAVVVLKGNGTIVAAPDGEMRMNSTGNPGMATGGSGDVLSGIIASFCGQGLSCFSAACAGVYVHGMAGDLAAETFGEYGITAGDLPMMTALALKKILSNE